MARFLTPVALVAALAATALLAGPQASAADSGNGAKVFASQCGICHAHAASAHSGVGPNLFGVVGRHAGTFPGFHYSSAMKNSGITWNADELGRYITNPSKTVPGNRMPYGGLHDTAKVNAVVAYLNTLK